MSHPLAQLVLFRIREFQRQPDVLFWALGFPLILMVVLGLAFRPKAPEPLPVLVAVAPGDARAEETRDRLARSKDLKVKALAPDEAERALTRGEAALLVIAGDRPTYRYDPTHPESRVTRALVDAALESAAGRRDVFVAVDKDAPALGARYIDWFVPGMLGMAIMNGCLWGIGFSLVEMRSNKLLKRFAVTPMRRSHFLLATMIHRFMVVTIEAALMLLFSGFAFGVEVQGSLVAFAAIAVLGTLAFAAISLLVASRTAKTEVAAGLMNIPMLPQMVLSGVFFASTKFPEWLLPAIKLLPLTALIDGLRRITNEGAGVDGVVREIVVLAAWTVATAAAATRLFRWT